MRILFKIVLFPIIVILSVCSLCCRFLTLISGAVMGTISILLALFTLLCLELQNGRGQKMYLYSVSYSVNLVYLHWHSYC